MGASLSGKQPGRGGRRRAYRPLAEINVTPFVDVMLVLLIVFMVAAPLLTAGIPVNLPKGAAQALETQEDPLWLTVTSDGRISLKDKAVFDDDEYTLEELQPRLIAVAEKTPDRKVLVRGDRKAQYAVIIDVLSEARRAGLTEAKLVIESDGRNR
ncbi:ExbD/TolR family protein [Rhodospirillum centenum]|uniref:Biopolymer transport ExbD protein n=1 Tax=Rhodospirillum centenum (strain ATCC 51521 / SW) TaxID=414684 RepID=B6ITI1_RHOCS|nr:ExbD/TolR family protein [Rhodospirillum centenum]ACI99199.1 biopolymer transport ExbD protein [Rhodospirillum centenum SW]